MSMTDPIADMLTRIRNANKALHSQVEMPASKMKVEMARLLKDEGYIAGFEVKSAEHGDVIVIDLKYGKNRAASSRASSASASRVAASTPARRRCPGCSAAWAPPSSPPPAA